MSKELLATVLLFSLAGVSLVLTGVYAVQYIEQTQAEQESIDNCQSDLCSPPVYFTGEYGQNMLIYGGAGAVFSIAGIVFLILHNRRKGMMTAPNGGSYP
jgi:hypothetical protein